MSRLTYDPNDIGIAVDGARIANMMPIIEQVIGREIEAVERQVFSAIKHNELSPDRALYAWQQVAAYRRLLKTLRTHVTLGTSTGHQITDTMSMEE